MTCVLAHMHYVLPETVSMPIPTLLIWALLVSLSMNFAETIMILLSLLTWQTQNLTSLLEFSAPSLRLRRLSRLSIPDTSWLWTYSLRALAWTPSTLLQRLQTPSELTLPHKSLAHSASLALHHQNELQRRQTRTTHRLKPPRRPGVAKSRGPCSIWTGSVCGHAHVPSVAHAADVVIQVVSMLSAGEAKGVPKKCHNHRSKRRFGGVFWSLSSFFWLLLQATITTTTSC